ncbi:hypothetical protein QN277_023445 [Acacia crassicarpa]|uniref:Uncharacterized protein n=1 Tax=Acacia crassicarpa TaxID=499986 RepID=A0AAE1JLB8_9FABA|nr:hypothetical protein QN277_023445 [Acacia crassicarpa]
MEDKLVWTKSKNGVYTVKLGYHSRKSCKSANVARPSSSTVIHPSCWKSIWKIKVIPRVQQFIWRLLSRAIATKAALVRRRRSQDNLCPVCVEAEESIEHVFFHCPWTRCVWFGCSLGARVDISSISNFNAWWILMTNSPQLSKHDLSLICWLLWFIWKARNEMTFDQREPNPNFVIEMARKNNVDFWAHCAKNWKEPLGSRGCDSPGTKWSPPDHVSLKINCDGAFSSYVSDAAIGVICRDFAGSFRWGFVDKVKSISAFMTEALALKRALLSALDLGHDKVIFETDCLSLLLCVQTKSPDKYDWKCRGIIYDIIRLLSSRVGFSLFFSPRGGNGAADFLAADAYKGVCPVGWVQRPTPALLSLLALEAPKTGDGVDNSSISGVTFEGG